MLGSRDLCSLILISLDLFFSLFLSLIMSQCNYWLREMVQAAHSDCTGVSDPTGWPVNICHHKKLC